MVRRRASTSAGIALFGTLAAGMPANASAQEAASAQEIASAQEVDHSIIFEIGAAGDWSRSEGFHPGGTVAFEVRPIERWLEVEVGFTAIRAEGSTEMPVDVLFKKPWPLGRTGEFMLGAGPEVVHATGPGGGTFWGIEGVVDLMFWPRRNVGWYVEPGYEVTFRNGARHGLAVAVGLLIGR